MSQELKQNEKNFIEYFVAVVLDARMDIPSTSNLPSKNFTGDVSAT